MAFALGTLDRQVASHAVMKRAALLLALCVVASACAGPRQAPGATGSPVPTPAEASGSAPTTVSSPDAAVPRGVASLPVLSVAQAVALIAAGNLDGQTAAVAGYYYAVIPSCPAPDRYIGPLESWCSFTAFTDRPEDARLCRPDGDNGTSCSRPTATSLTPFLVSETGGAIPFHEGVLGGGFDPVPLVLIGHAGDARQWRCTEQTQSACARAFVVDRVAWADGQAVPLTAPQTGDQATGRAVVPRLTLAQAAADAGIGDGLLTGAAFRAGDLATVDPRENLAGDGIVWLLRSLGPGTGPTRPLNEQIIDDTTGKLIETLPLALAAAYRPARLWQSATVAGLDCCGGQEFAFYRVVASDGMLLYDGMVSGGSSGQDGFTAFGGGAVRGGPLVLPAGADTGGARRGRHARHPRAA